MSLSLMSMLGKTPPINRHCVGICSYRICSTKTRSLMCVSQGKRFISSSIFTAGLGRIPSSCARKMTMPMPRWTSCYTTRILSESFDRITTHGIWISKYTTKSRQLPFEKNTNVTKNVMIFSYNDDRFYKLLSLFGLVQFLFWGYLSMFCYYTLKDAPVELGSSQDGGNGEKQPWWKLLNLGQDKYKNGIALLCFSIGYIVLFIAALYPLRAVQSLWLLKGGQSVGVTTFGPFGKKFLFVSPLEEISCIQSRTQTSNQIPLKIKDRWFFFLLDKKGVFHQPELFDHTIGLKRTLK